MVSILAGSSEAARRLYQSGAEFTKPPDSSHGFSTGAGGAFVKSASTSDVARTG
jgi:hypothetical protein